ncbi:hypothetical protein [Patulibacter sp. SYSU D01012]|uniref:hypothetical protein n=1 Tax=Patulibacter sp. SYSU D01012 TaxID=2817381 RepID=UPI001B30CCCD|nr:hypothetical protein [Patulibacter sp. SYSU D01012]
MQADGKGGGRRGSSLSQRGKPRKRPPAGSKPDAGFLGNVLGTVTGSVAEGSARAQGKSDREAKAVGQRERTRVVRGQVVRQYTGKTRAERQRAVAAAERRAAKGRASDNDREILAVHYRRAQQSQDRETKTDAANKRHDAAVQMQRLSEAIGGFTKPFGRVKPKTSALQEILGSLTGAKAGETLKDLGGGAVNLAAESVEGISKSLRRSSSGAIPGGGGRQVRAGIASDLPRAALLPVATSVEVAKVVKDDPGQVGRLPGDLAKMVKDIPAGVIQAAKDPAGAGKGILADYKRRYGPLVEGRNEEFRERLKKEGIAPEVVDVIGTFNTGGGARAVSGASRAVAKTTREGSRANRAANAVSRFTDAPRPDLLVAPNRAKPQRKAGNLPGLVVQRTVDRARSRRVTRQLEQTREGRQTLPAGRTRKEKKEGERIQLLRQLVSGVRGMVPDEGQVVPLRKGARNRAARKQVSRIQSTAFRRMDRLSTKLTRDAGRRFRALRPMEQRAAVHALEGTINPLDAQASIKAIDRRVAMITRERREAQVADPGAYAAQYAPLVNDPNVDELVQLRELRDQLEADPDAVLTPRLREFVAYEQQRRPAVERVAGESVRPSTQKARRYAPLGELVGTREAYVPRRSAIDRLEQVTPRKALEDIGRELKRARSGRRDARRSRELAAEARAVQQLVGSRPMNRKVPADVLDRARTVEADRFATATENAARAQGLGTPDPVFVKHRRNSTAGVASQFSGGGAERGAVAGPKKSNLSLFLKGFRDTSDRAYELGIQESIKRSVQWRMVNELFQDLVPEWARNSGKGFTLKEWDNAARKQLIDEQDWVAWAPKRLERDTVDVPDDGEVGGIPEGELVPLKDVRSVNWKTTDRFFVIPKDAMGEMKRGGAESITRATRAGQKFTGLQSQLILASMPTYGFRQAVQNVPVTLIAVGGRWVDPVMWRNLKAYRQAAKLKPDQFDDVQDVLGVRSRSLDAVRTERKGSVDLDARRFEGQLVHTWGGLFGASARDYFIAPRRSAGAAGTASQAARSAGKTATTPFRLTRDANLAFDAWQDRLARTLALAAEDARMSRRPAKAWADKVAKGTTEQAKRMGPLARALELPEDELAELARTAEFRRMVEDAADGMTRWLGDYANYTQNEQRIARSIIPFYGFARHSTRLLFYELPVHHPFTFAAMLSLSGASGREKERMLRDYLKQVGREGDIPEMLPGLALMANGSKLEVLDGRWMNPLTGPVFEVTSEGLGGATNLYTPLLKGILESQFQTNLFTKRALSNAQGAVDSKDNPLTVADQGRVIANRFLGSLFPYRVANDLVNGRKGKLTDTSLLFDPQPMPYKQKDSVERNDRRRADAAGYDDIDRLLDQLMPLRRRPATSVLNAAEAATEKQVGGTVDKKTRKPRKRADSGGWGGSSWGGSSWGSDGW